MRDDAVSEEALAEIATLPTCDQWPDLPEGELDHRRQVLWDISLRIMKDGPHVARPSDDRGRQFMPFAALRGYGEMLREVEEEAARDDGE